MLVVETIAKIRRAFFVQKKPIKAICRELRVSRKVVRKVIRSEATEFRYERGTQPLPKLGPWCEQLEAFLLANEQKAPRVSIGVQMLTGIGVQMLTTPQVEEVAACPGSAQEGPARRVARIKALAERRAGGACVPTWASGGISCGS
jgi:hypothetical protein